ncbi:MAG TPA: hypothetical protein VLQ20_07800 [Planococcus sp. (in: firmicutes)]|nr:hypothetical protein [Planococcus sp. (in: firmicutes)]
MVGTWYLPVFAMLLLGGYLLFSSLDKRIKSLEKRLNEFTAGTRPKAEQAVNEDLRNLLHRGKTVEAVRKAREEFGMSLLDAKRYVDKL